MTQCPEQARQTNERYRNPQYVILFLSDATSIKEYRQITTLDEIIASTPEAIYSLYVFDQDLIPIIPALWYCLHLPRARHDLCSASCNTIKTLQNWELPQHIWLIPVPCPKDIHFIISPYDPTIVIYPDDICDAARAFCHDVPLLLDVVPLSALNSQLLNKHWRDLHTALAKPEDQLLPIPPFLSDSVTRPYFLPAFFTSRQVADSADVGKIAEVNSKAEVLLYSIRTQAILSAVARLEKAEITNPTPAQLADCMSEEKSNFTCPVSVCVPGVSPGNSSRFLKKFSKGAPAIGRAHEEAEMSILGFLVSHRALARNGYAILSRELQDEAFHSLAKLEGMWADTTTLRPSKISRILGDISKSIRNVLDEEEEFAILHGSSLTVFSEFPIGLAALGTDTSPLVCRMPVAYRPLVPLTRSVQFELKSPPPHYLGDALRVNVIECIPPNDVVGRMSRVGWEVARTEHTGSDKIRWVFSKAASLKELRAIIAQQKSDILVLSAHGHFERSSNCAGFICGDEFILDQELGELPPVVVLSSCQIWPRGSGTVSVADLLFRQGAITVIGTLVPINVRRNALLITRFFVNVAAALEGEMPMRTIEDAWHHTATSNAVNDILDGNVNMSSWAHKGPPGESVIHEFMNRRSRGRLKKAHIYKDTEEVLLEIARDRGIERTFRAWMRNPGYIPESIFYTVLGWPERIVLNDPLLERLIHATGTRS